MAIPDLQTLPSVPLPDSLEPPSSVIIERVQPEIDAGRYPVKRVQGDILEVTADIFKDGHDKIAAVVKYRRTCDEDWQEAEMRLVENDRWAGGCSCQTTPATSTPSRPSPTAGRPGGTRSRKSSKPGRTSPSNCSKGVPSSPRRCRARGRTTVRLLEAAIAAIDPAAIRRRPCAMLLAPEVEAAMRRARSRRGETVYARELEVIVDRPAARFAAWYEMFPRSAGYRPDPERHLHRGRRDGSPPSPTWDSTSST